jgi:hypothetical protein
MMDRFSEWADQNMPDATVEHYRAWKAGHEQSKVLVLQLRSEIIRLQELISQLNHERNIG